MRQKIKIKTKGTEILAEINDEKNPKTAREILLQLPLKGRASRWGDEIYFTIPVSAPQENSQEAISVGSLAFWPEGNCFCIFFGKTPASLGTEPRAASAVNVFGKILNINEEAIEKLRSVKDGEEIIVEKTE